MSVRQFLLAPSVVVEGSCEKICSVNFANISEFHSSAIFSVWHRLSPRAERRTDHNTDTDRLQSPDTRHVILQRGNHLVSQGPGHQEERE